MRVPSLAVDPALSRAWPQLSLGALALELRVLPSGARGPFEDPMAFYEASVAPELLARLSSRELPSLPGVGEARRAFKAFGADPGRRRVSSEALYRRLRQGRDFPRVNSLVDAANLVSVETGLSVGAYDLERVGPELVLRKGRKDESYEGIGKGSVPLENLPLLCDGEGPFGSPVSDSRRALVSEESERVLAVLYCFSGPERLEEALELAGERLVRLAGASRLETLRAG